MTLQNQYSEGNDLNAYQNSGKRMDLSHHRHIASTPEGCRISRNDGIGFVVVCGEDGKVQEHVPTLPAAYAICQQLMPRRCKPES